MSDPFLPVPPEQVADGAAQQELRDVEEDRQPDVLPEPGEHHPSELEADLD